MENRGVDVREEKLQEIVKKGQRNVSTVLSEIEEELKARQDVIAKPSAITFDVNGGIHLSVKDTFEQASLTDHSKGQLFGRTQIPQRYADKLPLSDRKSVV